MSVELKCDRCGAIQGMTRPSDALASIAAVLRNQQTPTTWAAVMVSKNNVSARTYHLCSDCRGWLEDFMKGDATPEVPLPSTIVLQHQPAADCHLIWDPAVNAGKGGYICSHDEPDRFHFLAGQAASQQGVAQTVATDDWNEALGRVKPSSFFPVDDPEENNPGPEGEVRKGCTCEHGATQHGPFGCGYLGGCKCRWEPPVSEVPDEEPECGSCNHAPHAKDDCQGVIKTKKPGGLMPCPCKKNWSGIPTQREPENS